MAAARGGKCPRGEVAEWGTSAQLWWGCLMPRLHSYLPAGRVLEIGAGSGRFAVHVQRLAREMVLLDPVSACVEACEIRFGGRPEVQALRGDGRDLSMVEEASVDLAFSFDFLVHMEEEPLDDVLAGLARTLVVGGWAFLHHSNLRAILDADGEWGEPGRHGRAASVSARTVRELGERHGLVCTSQELVNWGGSRLTDCLSVLRLGGGSAGTFIVRENLRFMEEARVQRSLARLHRQGDSAEAVAAPHGED